MSGDGDGRGRRIPRFLVGVIILAVCCPVVVSYTLLVQEPAGADNEVDDAPPPSYQRDIYSSKCTGPGGDLDRHTCQATWEIAIELRALNEKLDRLLPQPVDRVGNE